MRPFLRSCELPLHPLAGILRPHIRPRTFLPTAMECVQTILIFATKELLARLEDLQPAPAQAVRHKGFGRASVRPLRLLQWFSLNTFATVNA